MKKAFTLVLCVSTVMTGCYTFIPVTKSDRTEPSRTRPWQITLADGAIVSQIVVNELRQDSLVVSDGFGIRTIPVQSITEIRYVREGSFWEGAETGAMIGGMIGAATGALVGVELARRPDSANRNKPSEVVGVAVIIGVLFGILYACPGAVIGGTIGAITGADDYHNLRKLPLPQKLMRIEAILSRHK